MQATQVSSASRAIDSDSPVHKNRSATFSTFLTDDDGNPTGGHSSAEGVSIEWQNGVKEPNGAILEDVIALCVDRLSFFQGSKFRCRENACAITKLEEALHWLNHRTLERRRRGVEGSYKT